MSKKTIILAAGGTGGHIFPAESLAEELSVRGYRPVLITDTRYLTYSAGVKKLEYFIIKTGMIEGGFFKKIKGILNIAIGYFQSLKIFRETKPSVVVGFGGYPSFPTMFYATGRKIKTIIHEQNSMLGRANYVLASRVDVIATSFPEVMGIDEKDVKKTIFTGNPVRGAIKILRDMKYPLITNDGVLKILITGGSQGASVFAKIVPEAVSFLPEDLRQRIRIDQQCRPSDIDEVRKKYKELGISADLATFFTDMPVRLASSHLVICRAGASTLAEITTVGRPALMVPYPHAKDNHQMVNANALEDSGGGWVMPEESFTPEALATRLESFLNLPSSLTEAAESAKKAGQPDADKNLADIVEKFCREIDRE